MLKKIIPFMAFCVLCASANAANPARRANAGQMGAAPRATASVNQLNSGILNPSASNKSSIRVEPDVAVQAAPIAKDTREKERTACMSNNIGAGNTFVWASRYSNTSNYASMVEDVEDPSNNVCFVRVELKSNDSRINVSDLPGKYFEMGQNITCGSWVDEDMLKQRILDAKKTARTLATIGGAVGGAGIGVGAMELFGNKLIGGKVQGQKALSGDDLFRSQLLVLKKDNNSEYRKIISELKIIQEECAKEGNADIPECKEYDYERLIATEEEK